MAWGGLFWGMRQEKVEKMKMGVGGRLVMGDGVGGVERRDFDLLLLERREKLPR